MCNDLVSIIIPTYGGGEFLKKSIDSVLAQSYANVEVIVVDDNGVGTENSKKTIKVMEEYKDNPKVSIIFHEVNKNGSAARNTGAKAAKGQYIGFLDDDDIYHVDNIKNQIEVLRELDSSYGLTYCSNEVYKGEKKVSEAHVWKEGYVFKDILTWKIEICTCSIIIRKSAFDSIGGFDESFQRHQDTEFLIRLTNKYKVKPVDYIGFRRCVVNRNSARTYEKAKEWRMHFFEKMKPYIELLPEKTQKDIYIYQSLDVAIMLLKEKRFLDYIKTYIGLRPGYRGIRSIVKRAIFHLKRILKKF